MRAGCWRGSTGVEGDAAPRGDAMLEEVVEQLLQLLGGTVA